MKARTLCLGIVFASSLMAGCVSIGTAGDAPALIQHRLVDPSGAAQVQRLEQPLVASLLIQALPADALADTTSMAYSRAPQAFAFYQFATWTERPVRVLPRLLQRRLESRGVAGAVGLLGEPIRSDWLLTLSVDTVHHDVSVTPGRTRLALTVELVDRRQRFRVARQQFATDVSTAQNDAATSSAAMAQAVSQTFDALLPWLESELQRASRAP